MKKEESQKEGPVKKTHDESKEGDVDSSKEEKGLKEALIGLSENKNLPLAVGAIILIIAVAGVFYLGGGEEVEVDVVNMSHATDIGAITVRGDGLPGYDIDRDGAADYLTNGFGYYKRLYQSGGFEYGPGAIELEEFGVEILLPQLHLNPEDIRESGVGSVVEFSAKDVNNTVSVIVIMKTLGPSLTSYNLFIDEVGGESYNIIDSIEEDGTGTIDVKEVEIRGHTVFRE